jgi:hypothetical protein
MPLLAYPERTDDKVYSLLLYTFARYTQWPEIESHDQFVITVVGYEKDWPVIKELEDKKNVYGLPIEVRFVQNINTIPKSHIVLVTKEFNERARYQMPDMALVVSEQASALTPGIDVNIYFESGKYRFQMDVNAIESRGLKVAAQLKNMST